MRNIREDPEALNDLRQLALDFLVKNEIQIPLRVQPELGVGLLGLLICKDFLLGLLLQAENQAIILVNFAEADSESLDALTRKRQVAFLEFDDVEVAFYYLSTTASDDMNVLQQTFLKA